MLKTRFRSLAAGLFAGLALVLSAPASAEEPMTPAEVEAIEQVVHDYLLKHPEVILEAIDALKARSAQQAADTQRRAVAERRDELLRDAAAPVGGNPDGAVTVVEFFDYQCPYCKAVAASLIKTVEAQDDVRIVFKEFPILGPASEFAAKAALAANRQDKYLDFHLGLMAARGQLTEAMVLGIAERSGLDMDRLRKDMEAPEIAETIARNQALADALQIRGTPAFVIGDQVVPGAISMEDLRKLIDAERSS
jgi:protein-disulfide isomerase